MPLRAPSADLWDESSAHGRSSSQEVHTLAFTVAVKPVSSSALQVADLVMQGGERQGVHLLARTRPVRAQLVPEVGAVRARERRRLVGVRLAHLGHVCVASGGAHPRVRPCAAPADGAATAASPPAARAWPNTSQGCAHGARRAPLPLPACSASCRTGRCGRTSCPSDRVAGLSACRRGRSSAPAPCAPPSGRRRARGRRARRAPAPCAAPGESTHMPSWKESAHARSSRAQGCKALYVTGCCKLARTAPVMHAANEQERGAITHAAERLLAATRRAPAHGQA